MIIGTASAVRSVRMMLETQMEYVEKQIEIEMTERKAREDLYAFKRQVQQAMLLYIRDLSSYALSLSPFISIISF